MLSFDPTRNTVRENYKLLVGSIIPRPIAFVTSVAKDGTVNGAPFSYFNIVSSEPPRISVSVQRKNHNTPKDTARNILHSKEFVVHIVDENNVEKINQTAASLPPDESEVTKESLEVLRSQVVSVPAIADSKVTFECLLERNIELGEGNNINTDLIIGKIVRIHIDREVYMNPGELIMKN